MFKLFGYPVVERIFHPVLIHKNLAKRYDMYLFVNNTWQCVNQVDEPIDAATLIETHHSGALVVDSEKNVACYVFPSA
jgi:hypothetical protein